MILLENNEIISVDKAVAEIFNDYFTNITSLLGKEETGKNMVSTDDVDESFELAIIRYSLHQCIKRIDNRKLSSC